MMKVTSIAQAKASEKILKSHIEDSELLSLAYGVLHKLMPTHVMDPFGSSSGELKKLINVVSTQFKSLEKSGEDKVQKEFNGKRLSWLKEVITKDKNLLATCMKKIQGSIFEAGKV